MKKLLSQYQDLVQEIKDLERRIKRLEEGTVTITRDTVKGSSPYFPYTERKFTIEGYNIKDLNKISELKNLLLERKTRCEDMKLKIEKFISEIPDSSIRRILQLRYIDGYEWLYISRQMGGYEESYARKKHDRYLEGLG